ncbi:glycosyltransferase family 61 protein [Cohnella caldifontis]|uniref:glycosyltransferase family 61 protein n=1 Tax=Cohnella caldifontis TaxID=3027471 RepID=UPI0023ED3EE8|nr:glycosyltransferase family 61 protein [Cohnella sp. YIM B05605]
MDEGEAGGAPLGICDTKEYVMSRYHEDRASHFYRECHLQDVTVLKDSTGIEDEVHHVFRSGVMHGQPAFVASVGQARLWGKHGAVITPDHRLLADVSWDYRGNDGLVRGWGHNAFREWVPHPLRFLPGTTALLTFVWSWNYFHWMFDVLPRVDLIRRADQDVDRYAISRYGMPYQRETLNLMGIPSDRIYEAGDDFHAEAERLIVPSFVRPVEDWPSRYPRWTAEFLRREFLYDRHVAVSPEYERIFVSRSKAQRRRMLNEDEIRLVLEERGFRTVILEELPFDEQIRIFASAKAVVAPHGAGLANLVFCPPGTQVVELFSPGYLWNYFAHICHQVGLGHYYLIGEYSVSQGPGAWEGLSDFAADPAKLRRLLDKAGI